MRLELFWRRIRRGGRLLQNQNYSSCAIQCSSFLTGWQIISSTGTIILSGIIYAVLNSVKELHYNYHLYLILIQLEAGRLYIHINNGFHKFAENKICNLQFLITKTVFSPTQFLGTSVLRVSHAKFLKFRKSSYCIAKLTLFFTLNQVWGLSVDTGPGFSLQGLVRVRKTVIM